MVPNACVVEVIERVPDADVAIVAARVGERLGMPSQRVRQLIEGRTGPITRALRPEKADAIAQTFEAVGVRVVVRAAEPEEIEEARVLSTLVTPPSSANASAGASAGTATRADAVSPSAPAEAPDERGPAAEHDMAEAPDDAPSEDVSPTSGSGDGDDTELVVGDEGGAVATEGQAGVRTPKPTREQDVEALDVEAFDAAATGDDEPVMHLGAANREPTFVGEALPVREVEAALEAVLRRTLGTEPEPESGPEPEPEPEPAAEPDVEPEPESEPEPAPEPDVEPDVEPEPEAEPEADMASAPGGDTGPAPAPDDVETAHEEPDEGLARGELPAARSAFPEGRAWDDTDPGTGAWSTRRGADAPPVPEFSIGRGSRQPRGEAPASPGRTAVPEVPVSDTAPEPSGDAAAAAPQVDRPVPTAWRGLGSDVPGPARPPSAPVPRRQAVVADADDADDALEPRVTRRRGVMLVALLVSVVLFVLAQWWTASRAATLDPFEAYRRGEFTVARATWTQAAAEGDASAQFMLGYLAEAGLGAPWSARTAGAWYRAAAEGGHAEAMWRLARLYEVGLGVAPDALEARRWYRTAAEAGHAEAAFAWGRLVLRDAGVALGAATPPAVSAATAAEAARAFARATALGWHEAAGYAAAFAAVAEPTP